MWIMLNDAFLSIVQKNGSGPGELLVRARREGDIEKVFGRRTKVTRTTDADYLFRAIVSREDCKRAMEREVDRIDYPNFKDSVIDTPLHNAYMGVWTNMASVQNPRPYSTRYKPKKLTKKERAAQKKANAGLDKALNFDAWPPHNHWSTVL